jgi:hypothetical protein
VGRPISSLRFYEMPLSPIHVLNGLLPRVRAAENRYLDTAVIIDLLDRRGISDPRKRGLARPFL